MEGQNECNNTTESQNHSSPSSPETPEQAQLFSDRSNLTIIRLFYNEPHINAKDTSGSGVQVVLIQYFQVKIPKSSPVAGL